MNHKPCPFCGCVDIQAADHDEPTGNVTYSAQCHNCGARGPVGDACTALSHVYVAAERRYVRADPELAALRHGQAKQVAMALWNDRPS